MTTVTSTLTAEGVSPSSFKLLEKSAWEKVFLDKRSLGPCVRSKSRDQQTLGNAEPEKRSQRPH